MIDNKMMEILQLFMDDEIREECHFKYAPCSNEYFIKKYMEKDTEFERLVVEECGIDVTEII